MEVEPAANNGTHGSLNHLLAKPFFNPVRPTEQSPPTQCPLTDIQPEDQLGCSCSPPVSLLHHPDPATPNPNPPQHYDTV